MATHLPGHLVHGCSSIQQGQRPTPTVDNQITRTFWSQNEYPPRISIIALFMQKSIFDNDIELAYQEGVIAPIAQAA
jgi:hypothetical protein